MCLMWLKKTNALIQHQSLYDFCGYINILGTYVTSILMCLMWLKKNNCTYTASILI